MSHTKGPWEIEHEIEKRFDPYTGEPKPERSRTWIKSGDSYVALMFQDRPTNDAALVAGAPELLELAKSFYEYAGRVCPGMLPKIEAIIAKIEGRE